MKLKSQWDKITIFLKYNLSEKNIFLFEKMYQNSDFIKN